MDFFNSNVDFNYILNTIADYSMYIFVCVIFGFGSLTYYLSIKAANPIFESPKLVTKKLKKEKAARSKATKASLLKVETKESIKIVTDQKSEQSREVIINNEPTITEEAGDEMWQPVSKSKKSAKVNVIPADKRSANQSKSVYKIDIQSSSKPVIESKPICDKSVNKAPVSIPDQPKLEVIETKPNPVDPIDNQSDEVSEKSSSDDFEILEAYKTSSEEGLKVEVVNDDKNRSIDDESISNQTSTTSGASRKKSKKRQKMISKQLIEAAEETIATEPKEKLPFFPLKNSPVVLVEKKRRPRKDV